MRRCPLLQAIALRQVCRNERSQQKHETASLGSKTEPSVTSATQNKKNIHRNRTYQTQNRFGRSLHMIHAARARTHTGQIKAKMEQKRATARKSSLHGSKNQIKATKVRRNNRTSGARRNKPRNATKCKAGPCAKTDR
jgi:hypothetical protein